MDEVSNGNGKLCAACGVNQANKGHTWCSDCKMKKQGEYARDRDTMMERRGFQAGVEAMRAELLRHFKNAHPAGFLRAGEVANFIAAAETPRQSA